MAGWASEFRKCHKPRLAGLGVILCVQYLLATAAAFGQTTTSATTAPDATTDQSTSTPTATAEPPAPPAVNNPHWTADGCRQCHEMTGGKPKAITVTAVDALCVSCHDGAKSPAEIHPISLKMLDRTGPNPGWPTLDGKLFCLSCHDIRQQCDPAAQRPDTNTAFLRQTFPPPATQPVATTDPNAPAGDQSAQLAAVNPNPFCDNCHAPDQFQKFSPHRMLAGDGHTVIEQRCEVCHSKPMDRNATARTGNASLRADMVTLCRSCHPHHRDINRKGHVGTTIPPHMLVYMRARELTGLLDAPSDDLMKQLTDEKAMPMQMVPDAQGRIVCTTCHNPHEKGTFSPNCVLDDRSLRLVNGHLFTPVRGQAFCRRCHTF
jgi:predicted CXXCH cytochrome family protein